MGRILVVIVLGSLAGCDHLLDLGPIQPIVDAHSLDAPSLDAPSLDAPLDGPDVQCLSDNFDHPSIDVNVWPNFYNTAPSFVSDDGSQLVVMLGTASGNAYAGVITSPYNFAAMRTQVEVVQIPAAPGATIELAWRDPASQDRLHIYVDGSHIYFGQIVGSGPTDFGVLYDAAAMRFWQIRHELGAATVSFETSPDGRTWTVQHSLFPPISLASIVVELQAGTYTSLMSPGTGKFDNFAMYGACN